MKTKTSTYGTADVGTDLYRRTMAADYGDAERSVLMKSEWTPTPYMIDVNIGERREEMRHWCHINLGRESSPMHGHEGSWRQSNVTLLGRSWFGFRSEPIMRRFMEHFPGTVPVSLLK